MSYSYIIIMMAVCADKRPVCEADHSPVVSGTNNSVTCRFNYTRFSNLSPAATLTSSVTWPDGESGHFRSSPADPHRTGAVSATVADVTVTSEGISSINWTVDFAFSVQSTYRDYARNNETWTWTSDVIPVWSELQPTLILYHDPEYC